MLLGGASAYLFSGIPGAEPSQVAWSVAMGLLGALSMIGLMFLVSLILAPVQMASEHEATHAEMNDAKLELEATIKTLRKQLEPGLVFVDEVCCRPRPEVLLLGVGNPNSRTVHDAHVYATVLEIANANDKVLQWNGMGFQSLDIHHAPLPHHHHTDVFASVGDRDGQFFLHFAHGHVPVEAGSYTVDLCVRGKDAMAATARLEVTFTHPRSLAARLVLTP
jgi:hypothetical protein